MNHEKKRSIMPPPNDLFIVYQIGLIVLLATLASKLCVKIKLPGLLGAIVVGLFLGGPGSIGLIKDTEELKLFGTFGAILLLFMCGLEFDAAKFFILGKQVLALTLLGVLFAIGAGFAFGRLIGWSTHASLLLGVMISFSGTSIVSALLLQKKIISTEEGAFLMTAAVADDIIGIIIFSVTMSTVREQDVSLGIIGINALFAVLFVGGAIFIGSITFTKWIPRLEKYMKEDEIFLLLTGLGLVIAFISAYYFNLAAITGAFIVGAIIPRKNFGDRLGERFNLMKDVFVALFFTGIGVVLNPFDIAALIPLGLLLLVVALFARSVGALIGGRLSHQKGKKMLFTTVGLSMRGEMSLIIAQEGIAEGVVDYNFMILAFLVIIGSIVICMPLFNRMLPAQQNKPEESLASPQLLK
jgi:Kef-type K+ transport system membrane component KefB